ncbi:MAG: arginyltransferase [Pirellulaceae bacterium]|nr:arginyltransferase [Pirellulaceae bacterium]
MIEHLRVFSDDSSPCSYLPDQVARLPMCLPTVAVGLDQFDQLMELGYRRSGSFYYRPHCPTCTACQPIRLEVSRFQPSRSQRRALQRSTGMDFRLDEPTVDTERVDLFNRHRLQRQLARNQQPLTVDDYRSFLLHAPNASLELSLWMQDHLIAISITDVGRNCLSAVYCFFEPACAAWSPGTLCILRQIELAQRHGLQWLYLGYYVATNRHLNYKAKYRPHQRRIEDTWLDSDSGLCNQNGQEAT